MARMWDVRDAALMRYGDHVDRRLYQSERENGAAGTEGGHDAGCRPPSQARPAVPRPLREAEVADDGSGVMNNLGGLDMRDDIRVGDFVANNNIDEGVTLLAQMQHGERHSTGVFSCVDSNGSAYTRLTHLF